MLSPVALLLWFGVPCLVPELPYQTSVKKNPHSNSHNRFIHHAPQDFHRRQVSLATYMKDKKATEN